MSIPRTIDWRLTTEADFNRIVDALIVKEFMSQDRVEAASIEGRGGDEGIDIGVWRDGVLATIFQLKHFPEGFSGYHGKTRKSQIRKSFARAIDAHPEISEWVLVVPSKASLNERKFVTALGGDASRRTRILGATELDLLLGKHPEINSWATHEPLLEALKEIDIGRHLSNMSDFASASQDLSHRADRFSPYWGIEVTTNATSQALSLFAKRPDAHMKEPISLAFTAAFRPEHSSLRTQFESAMRFGLTERIDLPPEAIQDFRLAGPEWLRGAAEGPGSLSLRPSKLKDNLVVELRALDEHDRVVAALSGKTVALASGADGATVITRFQDALSIEWIVDSLTREVTLNLALKLEGVHACDARRVLTFVKLMRGANKLSLLSRDQVVLSVDGSEEFRNAGELLSPLVVSLVEDLAFLEERLPVIFEVPQEASAEDHVRARFARMMLEGKVAVFPGVKGLTFTLSGEALDTITELAQATGRQLRLDQPNFPFLLLGRTIDLGTIGIWHPSMAVSNPREVIDAIDAGHGKGFQIEINPTDETGFRAFSADLVDPAAPIVPEAWAIPEIAEHPSFLRIREAAMTISESEMFEEG